MSTTNPKTMTMTGSMSGIPEDATFEEPELACMLESLQKGKKGSGKVSVEARKAGARVSPVMF